MICSSEKTKLLIIGSEANTRAKLTKENLSLKIAVNGKDVKESKSETLLGLIVNNKMNWKNNLYGDEENSVLMKELSNRVGILKKLRPILPLRKLKQVISSIFTSKLIYCITIWGGV